jgi:hypothetical protein
MDNYFAFINSMLTCAVSNNAFNINVTAITQEKSFPITQDAGGKRAKR